MVPTGSYTDPSMTLLRILYWGLSYSVGLICTTAVFLRYIQAHDTYALKLAGYLVPFGLALASLSLMEAFPLGSFANHFFGQLALVGASLVIVTFPSYALCFDDIRSRRRIASVLRFCGVVLAVLNLLSLFLPPFLMACIRFLTFGVLGATIFIGMSWMSRGERLLHKKHHHAWMASLFVFFALVVVLDFFREFIPGLKGTELRYVVLPAFYAYLNIFLLHSHVTLWSRQITEHATAVVPTVETLKRYGVSSRETEVLSHLSRGRTYGEIADVLCVSMATIKTHLSHLYEKTGTRNKVELINLLYDSIESPQNQPNAR
jgi:DNA-binding CsgD family transcriptional regulator